MNEIEQKEIEEMAKVLSTVKRCEALALSECIKKKCEYPHYEGVTCIAEHQAETLFSAGYHNCKDKVVLSKKKYREFLEMKRNVKNSKEYKIGSKETAREIIEMFADRNYITEKDLINAIAQRYGVEIKE